MLNAVPALDFERSYCSDCYVLIKLCAGEYSPLGYDAVLIVNCD